MYSKYLKRSWPAAIKIFLSLLLLPGICFAEPAAGKKARDFFQVGEVLSYDVLWTAIPCGEVKIKIKDLFQYEGQDVFHFELTGESNMFLSTFYKVNDKIISYADADELYSLRFEKHLREGDYEKDQVVLYDIDRSIALYEEPSGKKEINVAEKAIDTLACFYLFRMMDLDVGSELHFEVDSNKKHFRLTARACEKEQIEIRNRGVFDTTRVEVDIEKIKENEENEITKKGIVLWVLNDDGRIPVRIRTSVFFGEIDMILKQETPKKGR